MNTKLNKLGWLGILVAPSFLAASALATPGWNYPDAIAPGGVSSWGQIVDSTSTAPVPLNYPYSECGVGEHQSPINANSTDLVQRSGSDIINFYYKTADKLSTFTVLPISMPLPILIFNCPLD